jgi:hypothetical protein
MLNTHEAGSPSFAFRSIARPSTETVDPSNVHVPWHEEDALQVRSNVPERSWGVDGLAENSRAPAMLYAIRDMCDLQESCRKVAARSMTRQTFAN